VSGPNLVVLDRVAVGYGRQPVLEGVTLEIRAGSFVGMLGPNGAGKTTLLKTIAGILPPLAGKIAVTANEFHVGYVPQRESLDPIFLFSSLEVVLMGLCGRLGPGQLITKRERALARQCLEKTGAADLAQKRFSELSGGQKQRVLISRALANTPNLLLLDEPTAGIDLAATETILNLLMGLRREGMTILMVNHDFAALRRAVDEVFWIHEGQAFHGPVNEMLNREHLEKYLGVELR
jgi:manganese/zinc/iron transport system ATP- binding protein